MGWNLFKKKTKQTVQESNNESFESANLKVIILSDLGNIRTNNEDMGLFFKIADENIIREKGCMLMVADGMGGHQAGEVASKMASEIISREYFEQTNGTVEKNLAAAFIQANKKIFEKSTSSQTHKGMGTTCTVLVVIDQDIYFAHVGDSRAYIVKGDSIMQITTDQTYVQELVNSGEITAAEAAVHPKRNVLTNAMGTKPDMKVDTGKYKYRFENNDRLLLCSDGLYDYLNQEELKEILLQNSLKAAADKMIQEAKTRGGHDNITVVIAGRAVKTDESTEGIKLTRDIELPKMTRNADLPSGT